MLWCFAISSLIIGYSPNIAVLLHYMKLFASSPILTTFGWAIPWQNCRWNWLEPMGIPNFLIKNDSVKVQCLYVCWIPFLSFLFFLERPKFLGRAYLLALYGQGGKSKLATTLMVTKGIKTDWLFLINFQKCFLKCPVMF